MADYSEMGHEELAQAADPLNRIVTRDYPILGYEPTDEQVTAAQAELDQLNAACRVLNLTNPHHAGAIGPEGGRLRPDQVKLLVDHELANPERAGRVEPPA